MTRKVAYVIMVGLLIFLLMACTSARGKVPVTPSPGIVETIPLPTKTIPATKEPTPVPSETVVPTPEIPESWKNWTGDVKDFSSYIPIEKLSDLDRLIEYYKTQDTWSYPSPTVCDLKLKAEYDKVNEYTRLYYVEPPARCAKDDLPAQNVVAARMPVSVTAENGQVYETFLFIVQKRYTPEGPIYMKYITSKNYMDWVREGEFGHYIDTAYDHLSKSWWRLDPLFEYKPTGSIPQGANPGIEWMLNKLGFPYYNAGAHKEVLTQLMTHSTENTPVPQDLRDEIESMLFFFSFNSW